VFLARPPEVAGDRLDHHEPRILRADLLDERFEIAQVLRVTSEAVVVRGEDRVEREPAQRLEMHRGRLHPVTGDADRAGEPFLASADGALERTAGRGAPVQIVEGSDRVELDQVDPRDL
jgi:hypothetical protein